MSPEILSVYSKYWKSGTDNFELTFLHDSAHCTHCLNGGIKLSRLKQKKKFEKYDDKELKQSFFKRANLRINQSDIPKDSISPLGLILTNNLVKKLKSCNGLTYGDTKQLTNDLLVKSEIKYENFNLQEKNESKDNIKLLRRKTVKDKYKRTENKTVKAIHKLSKVRPRRPNIRVRPNILKKELESGPKPKISKKQICKEKAPRNLKKCGSDKTTCKGLNSKNKKFQLNTKAIIQKNICKKILSSIPLPEVRSTQEILEKAESIVNSKTFKEPSLGTLKRKRWQIEKLKESRKCYEDDLFEDKKFNNFKPVKVDSDSEEYNEMITPRISLSPTQDGSSSPHYDDCYSPSELLLSRKEAEEYLYRREKRRKTKTSDEKNSSKTSPVICKNSAEYTSKILSDTCKILEQVKSKPEDTDSEEEKDDYFSDVSD